jgi:putative transposase
VRYACIAANRMFYPVTMMCRVLEVSRAGFYAAQARAPSQRACTKRRVLLEIRAIHAESRECYGSPRVHDELQARDIRCSENQVARLMREDGLRARKRRRFRITTNSNHSHDPAENVLDRNFAIEKQTGLDRVWVADITYIPTREGWLYLSVILDVASRIVVGWSTSRTIDRSLCINALQMALENRRPEAGLIHHSDRGVQYACNEYRQ